MAARGFRPPEKFKALVVEVTLDSEGERRVVARERWFDYGGTSRDVDWNPASTVKIFAAIAALRKLEELKVSPRSRAVFEGLRKSPELRVHELVELALVPSDNLAFNRLVLLAGFDYLNGGVIRDLLGLKNTAIHLAYGASAWKRLGGQKTLRDSPRLVLKGKRHNCEVPPEIHQQCMGPCLPRCQKYKYPRSRRECARRCRDRCRRCPREVVVQPRRGTGTYPCPEKTCTTLGELAETMRRLMLQEELHNSGAGEPPSEDRRVLSDFAYWKVVVRALKGFGRERGNNVRVGLHAGFAPEAVVLYSKPGYATGWYSDVVYVLKPNSNRRWVVALAGYPGRQSLNQAARVIGRLLSSGELAKADHVVAE